MLAFVTARPENQREVKNIEDLAQRVIATSCSFAVFPPCSFAPG